MLRSSAPVHCRFIQHPLCRRLQASLYQQPTRSRQRQPRLQPQNSGGDDYGMSTCAALAAAIGAQLLLQQPSLAQPPPIATPSTASMRQIMTTEETGAVTAANEITMECVVGSNAESMHAGSSARLHSLNPLIAPNVVHSLSQDDSTNGSQQLSTPQPTLPSQPDAQDPPSTSGASPEGRAPLLPPPPTPPAPEDPQKTEEEQRKSLRKTRRSRIKELEDTRLELAEKQLKLIEREKELLDKDQTVSTLREELDLERKLRALLTKEKDKAEEEAALAMGLCTGAFTLP